MDKQMDKDIYRGCIAMLCAMVEQQVKSLEIAAMDARPLDSRFLGETRCGRVREIEAICKWLNAPLNVKGTPWESLENACDYLDSISAQAVRDKYEWHLSVVRGMLRTWEAKRKGGINAK